MKIHLDPSPSATGCELRAAVLLFAMTLVVALAGCGQKRLERHAIDVGSPATFQGESVAALLDGREISVGEIHEHLKEQFLKEFLDQPADREYEMLRQALRDLAQTFIIEAEARRHGQSVDDLREEIVSKVEDPSDDEIASWYAANKGRLRNARFEDISGQIETHLRDERRDRALEDFIGPKLEALSWQVLLPPPRVEFAATHLVRGPLDAPVTIMAFSDYQCPYCIRAEPVLAEVLERYPDNVRLVHRHFPLDKIHPFARPAAEAAMCADEQGSFWEYHKAIFDLQGRFSEDSLVGIGNDLGLDLAELRLCIEERRFKNFVEADFAAGRDAGVTGTPAFFINGIAIKGARSADELSHHVDLELARIGGR